MFSFILQLASLTSTCGSHISSAFLTRVVPVAKASATPQVSPTTTVSAGAMNMQQMVNHYITSDASAKEKTGFFLEYLKSQREPLLNFGKTVLIALLVFLIGKKIIKFLIHIIRRMLERSEVDPGVEKFTLSLLRAVFLILLIFMVAGILGVGTSTIVAIVGSAGLTVGLALQGSLSNFAGGVLILLMKPFQVGDYISASGVDGTVSSIDIFYTRIVTVDYRVVVIPNGTLSNGNIINFSKEEERLLILDFMVSEKTDITKLRLLFTEAMTKEPMILQEKPISVEVDRLTPYHAKIIVKAWVKNKEYWPERTHLLEQLKICMEKNQISMISE